MQIRIESLRDKLEYFDDDDDPHHSDSTWVEDMCLEFKWHLIEIISQK